MSLDPYGRDLARRLFAIKSSSGDTFTKIVEATRSVLGLPTDLEVRETEERYYLVQGEQGLKHKVHQTGVRSGTLRMLAMMTAVYAEPACTVIGIEEPENCIHPAALESFAKHLLDIR